VTPDQQTIQHIIDTHFGPLIAPTDCAAQGRSPGILVGVIADAQRHYFQCGQVPMALPPRSRRPPTRSARRSD
jgi:hypothetical protein